MAVKILIVTDGLLSGGAERQIIELLKGLKQQPEMTTALCVLSGGGAREREGVTAADSIISVSVARDAGMQLLMRFPLIVLQALRACSSSPPDIVHTYGCFADILGVFLSRKFGIPFINGSIRAARPKLNHRDRISQLTFPYAATIVANSLAGLRSFGMQEKGVAIHNGVQLARFDNVVTAQKSGEPVLSMVGNFTDKKDQKRLIRCLPAIRETYADIRLILVGRGKNIEQCKEYSKQLGCGDHIQFVEDCDNPEPYIASSDVCVSISNIAVHGEGISNAIIEYMALGKPVVASDCGGNSELLVDGVTGILIPNNDSARIADAIMALLGNPDRCKQMSQAGRSRIENEFSIDRMINSYVQLYRETAARI